MSGPLTPPGGPLPFVRAPSSPHAWDLSPGRAGLWWHGHQPLPARGTFRTGRGAKHDEAPGFLRGLLVNGQPLPHMLHGQAVCEMQLPLSSYT
jgi:hypothetical protein